MKTFVEFLPTMTAREREIVEAFHAAMEAWHEDDNPKIDWPIGIMQSTPPSKEPVSEVLRVVWVNRLGVAVKISEGFAKINDRVLVVKIEEPM